MVPLYVRLSAMPASIRLVTTNQKFAIIWACLAFAVKNPDRSIRIPSKTIEVLFGTTVSAATVKALKNVRWTNDDAIDLFSVPLNMTAQRRQSGGCRLMRPYWILPAASRMKTSFRKSVTVSPTSLGPFSNWPMMNFRANSRPGIRKLFALSFTAPSSSNRHPPAVPSL